jgi:hypothetical protein
MTKTRNMRLLLASVLFLVMLVALVNPVGATTTLRIDLNKTYQFKATNLTHINTLDLWDPSASSVEIQTTAGDNSDVQVIQQPKINTIVRNFSATSATDGMGNFVTIAGPQVSTIVASSTPAYRIYITPSVPTFKVTVPGGMTGTSGNPMAAKYNASWTGTILNAADATYLYNGSGILHVKTTGAVQYTAFGTIPFDQNDVNSTLFNNRVSLSPYTGNAAAAESMGSAFNNTLAGTGKYFAGALIHDNGQQTTTIQALTPLVVLNQQTPITWSDDYGTHQLPMTYVKGGMGDVTLKFASSDPTHPVTHIGYLFVNSTAQYSMQVKVNTQQLADNTNDQWQTLSPPTNVVEILYEGIINTGSPFSYFMKPAGQANDPDATQFSAFAITPGYGISGSGLPGASQITIPAGNFSSLSDGIYYVYLMGTNDNKDIVALSQSTVYIKGGAVPDPTSATITSIAPVTGTRNSTVSFTLTGTNFPTAFGTSGVMVNLTNSTRSTITTHINSVTSTTITGTFDIGQTSNSLWDVVLTTNDAGTTVKTGAFSIVNTRAPVITAMVPVSAYQNTTTFVTITGSNFPTDSDMTQVKLTQGSYLDKNLTINSITPTSINGTLVVGKTAAVGGWSLSMTNVDGGASNTLANAFTVKSVIVPVITAVAPVSSYQNTTTFFTITGTGFPTGSDMTHVNFSQGSYFEKNVTINFVTATSINGTLAINRTAPFGKWNVGVTTTDGTKSNTLVNAFTVKNLSVPVITAVAPASAFQNTTTFFTITGTGFPTGSDMTHVNFSQGSYFEKNVTINSVTATSINGTLIVNKKAPFGKWNVSVTTADDTMSNTLVNAFTVKTLSVPVITVVAPVTSFQNTTTFFTITGTGFPTGSDMTHVNFSQGSYFEKNVTINFVTATSINGTLAINRTAPFGKWNVGVTTIDGSVSNTLMNAFTVKNLSVPVITAVAPVSAFQNTTTFFTITGTGFPTGSDMTHVNFSQGSYFEKNVTINFVTATAINGTIAVNKAAPSGNWNVGVTTTDGTLSNTLAGKFAINQRSAPVVNVLTPTTAFRNTTVPFTLTGSNFRTEPGYTNVTLVGYSFSGTVEYYGALTTVTNNQITGTIALPPDAPSGAYDINVTTVDGGTTSRGNAFSVLALPPPTITAINQTSGYKNSTVIFSVTGSNFQPGSDTTFVRLYSPANGAISATVNTVTSTKIVGSFAIPAGQAAGSYRLDVATISGGYASKLNAFTVNPAPKPVISAISPATSYTNRTFVITTTGSNFQPDGLTLTTVNLISPTNVYYNVSLISATTTRFNGTVTIPVGAPVGAYKLNVTTSDGGTTSRPSAVTVSSFPAPTFGTITPISGYENTTVSFTITGTNFQPEGTNVTFWNRSGNQVLVPTTFSITPTQFVGSVVVPKFSNGTWYVNISTVDGGKIAKEKAFTVSRMPKAVITGFTPTTILAGTTVPYTLNGNFFQTRKGTMVSFTNATGTVIQSTVDSAYMTRVIGSVTVPTGMPAGVWAVNVTTVDAGWSNQTKAFTSH